MSLSSTPAFCAFCVRLAKKKESAPRNRRAPVVLFSSPFDHRPPPLRSTTDHRRSRSPPLRSTTDPVVPKSTIRWGLFFEHGFIGDIKRSSEYGRIAHCAEVSQPTEEIILPVETVKSSKFCQLCEQYASEAIDYLSRSETQTEIFSALYHVCSKLDYLKQQCITIVDYYVPLLFEEVEDISPDDLCDRFKLCKGDARQRLSFVEGDNYKPTKLENMLVGSKKSSQWCKTCEKVATDALSYLEKNQTETEIIAFLHQDCAKLDNFEEECVVLVDYYSPLLFSEIKKISPEIFCENIHFCISEEVSVATRFNKKIEQFNEDTCSICEEVVEQIATKLKDPDTQYEIIKILLEECKKTDNYVKQCKRLVLTYGPLFLARLEKFLETQDVCTRIHACKSSMQRFSGDVVIASA